VLLKRDVATKFKGKIVEAGAVLTQELLQSTGSQVNFTLPIVRAARGARNNTQKERYSFIAVLAHSLLYRMK
jgi:hypothetical protein